jgi:hypothetical protein
MRPGNSRDFSPKRFAQASDRCANRSEANGADLIM